MLDVGPALCQMECYVNVLCLLDKDFFIRSKQSSRCILMTWIVCVLYMNSLIAKCAYNRF